MTRIDAYHARRYDALLVAGGFLIGSVAALASNFDPLGTVLVIAVAAPCFVAVFRRLPRESRR